MKKILSNVHFQFSGSIMALTVFMLLLIQAAPFLNMKISTILAPQNEAGPKPESQRPLTLARPVAAVLRAADSESALPPPQLRPPTQALPPEPPPVQLTEVTAADAALAKSLQTNQTLTVQADYSAAEIARWLKSGAGQLVAFNPSEQVPTQFLFRPSISPNDNWATNRSATLWRLGLALSDLGPLESVVAEVRAKAGTTSLTTSYVLDSDLAGQVRTKVAAALRQAGVADLPTNVTVRGQLSSKAKTGRPFFRLQSVTAAGQPPVIVNDLLE